MASMLELPGQARKPSTPIGLRVQNASPLVELLSSAVKPVNNPLLATRSAPPGLQVNTTPNTGSVVQRDINATPVQSNLPQSVLNNPPLPPTRPVTPPMTGPWDDPNGMTASPMASALQTLTGTLPPGLIQFGAGGVANQRNAPIYTSAQLPKPLG